VSVTTKTGDSEGLANILVRALVLSSLTATPGCLLQRAGTGGLDGGGFDAETDAALACPFGRVDLDGLPGCECEIGLESCNGMDDDCDRNVDEDIAVACGTPGTCSEGTRTCVGGTLGECVVSTTPPDEICDNVVDDDCDMAVDEGCVCSPVGAPRACGSDVGACVAGNQTCSVEGWSACEGSVGPSLEGCNGIDDDCDGTVDGMMTPCSTDVGACTAGFRTCTMGVVGPCSGVEPAPRDLCDAARVDDDCNGIANDGCPCDDTSTRPCGACRGTQICDISGRWGMCVDLVSTETCNGVDDNCDGTTDEMTTCGMCTQVNNGTRSYLFCFSITRTWDDARAYCMMFGYDLVTVESGTENDWLNAAERRLGGNNQDWWYGGTDAAMEGTWRWAPTMTDVGYSDWVGAEPGAGGAAENCMSNENRSSPEWSSRACSQMYRFVCEDQDS